MSREITDETLFNLIPQRPPIVMVDLLRNVTADAAQTGLLIRPTNIFIQDGHLQEPGLIEHIAQSAAAFAGYKGYSQGLPPKLGYIGEIKKMHIHALPEAGKRLETQLNVLGEAGGITLLAAQTSVDGQVVAEGQMKIFLKED